MNKKDTVTKQFKANIKHQTYTPVHMFTSKEQIIIMKGTAEPSPLQYFCAPELLATS